MARPTLYRAAYVEQARQLCELGATELELADSFGVTVQTIRNWAKDHKPFFEALKNGKSHADERVTKSLYHRAIGYSFDTVKIVMQDGKPVQIPYREHVPPDTTACIFWLKNRRADLWRDKIDLAGRHEHRHAHLHAMVGQLDMSRYTPEQLAAIEEFAAAIGANPQGSDSSAAMASGPTRVEPPRES